MRLLAAETEAAAAFARWARERFGDRLERVALFGSRARGEGTEDSDLDVVLVVDALTGAEAREIGAFAGDLLTEHDVLVSPLALSSARMAELRRRERRIVSEIDRDAVAL